MDAAAIRDWRLAAQHFAAGRYAEAATTLQAILAADPASSQAWLALARIDIQTAGVRQAYAHALMAARHAPAAALRSLLSLAPENARCPAARRHGPRQRTA